MIHESIGTQIAISPDGRNIAYVGISPTAQLYVRPIDRLDAQPIAGTNGARQPFFSPDSRFIGFWATAEGEIRRVALAGGPVTTIAKAPSGTFYGGAWGRDDTIVFASGSLYRVPATGGTPEQVTTPDPARSEAEHRWPEVLSAGDALLYTAWGGHLDRTRIDAWSPSSKQRTTLVEGATMPRYSASGHLVYQQGGNLMAAAFDARSLTLAGRAVSLDEQIKTTVSGAADFSIATDGTLVLMAGTSSPDRRLMWVDRKGGPRPLLDTPDDYWLPRISPDGRRLAIGIGSDLWVVELARLSRTRVTFGTTNTLFPYTWSKDGRSILFSLVSNKTGLDIHSIPADGSGQPQLVSAGEHRQWAISTSPVSDDIAIYEQHPTTLRDIWIVPGSGKRRAFLATPFQERAPRFSPDGRWIVYVSNDSGRDEVYVRAASGEGRRITVSTDGGSEPVWTSGGREIMYRTAGHVMSAAVTMSTPELTVDRPQVLFATTFESDRGSGAANPNYDVTADGQRFVMIQAPVAPTSLIVIVNWFEQLRSRVLAGAR
jgi:serine/threonine-protein kinase